MTERGPLPRDDRGIVYRSVRHTAGLERRLRAAADARGVSVNAVKVAALTRYVDELEEAGRG